MALFSAVEVVQVYHFAPFVLNVITTSRPFISKRQRITLRLLYAIGRPSVVCLSSVCDVGAPYSGG